MKKDTDSTQTDKIAVSFRSSGGSEKYTQIVNTVHGFQLVPILHKQISCPSIAV